MLARTQRLIEMVYRIQAQSRASYGCSRGAAGAAVRDMDPLVPTTWEFGGFSQHGEDGIIDHLCSQMLSPNRFFFEIGASDGGENCTSWLAIARNFEGVMVEGDPTASRNCRSLLQSLGKGAVHTLCSYVNLENISSILGMCRFQDPDVFVLDIDSMDFHIMKRVLELEYRPKLCVLEYNAAFGPDQPLTIPYSSPFTREVAHPSKLYYGAGVAAWKKLLGSFGYRFVTVDQSGVNAFFIDPSAFPANYADQLRGLPFRNATCDWNGATMPYTDAEGVRRLPAPEWQQLFALIRDLPFHTA